jgi:hypothetical protein
VWSAFCYAYFVSKNKTKKEHIMQDTPIVLDKATVLIHIYIIVEAILGQPAISSRLVRPGPQPKCPDAEIITMAVYQELVGDPREDHFYRMQLPFLKSWFPNIPERSRYNRRKRSLAWIILLIRLSILTMLMQDCKQAAIDSAPVPVTGYKRNKSAAWSEIAAYGRCAAKALKFYGCRLTTLVGETGVIMDFVLTAANHYDNQVVPEFIAQYAYRDLLEKIIGDKAYNDQKLQADLLKEFGIRLKAPKKDNQVVKDGDQFVSSRAEAVQRLKAELVNSQLQEQLHLSKHYAKSTHGLFTRIAAKITAHTIGILINITLGRKPLALAGLAY